ncbi:DEAD/DEAH box helicase [Leptospira fluminis]|uniref:DEAD/DEAH box helicase n=1 Tax=Leptospira fluminis TaxID=2484979 RepID=A0A4R9GSF9_9LEPT|nr:DEAD/DEAH box helicase [Leptospira fluminis]TGK20076.1 DEAD/DEAH box helicase [Leptospira fluminis]
MYNPQVEEKIKEIPKIEGIDLDRLPQELTKAFAEIVHFRRILATGQELDLDNISNRLESLMKLAYNLETAISIVPNRKNRDSVAFVSATAHFLILQFQNIENQGIRIDAPFRDDSISPGISAVLLFMIGNSPADAAEISTKLQSNKNIKPIHSVLLRYIKNLAQGKLNEILTQEEVLSFFSSDDSYYNSAADILWIKICLGLKELAARLLGKHGNKYSDYFQEVIELSKMDLDNNRVSIFAGPYHLAKLLKILENDLIERSVMNIPPPTGIDNSSWHKLILNIVSERPYLWENHYEAIINYSFLNMGVSGVLTFPTGAGKSTLSELKAAVALLLGKSVVYLVPTHSLEEQINDNMKRIFPEYSSDLIFEMDAEYTDIGLRELPKISVMTPERCLTLFGVNSELFRNVGLIIFDEFHLISGKADNLDRRNVDAMLCLLMFLSWYPQADYLLISAMVANGEEISHWISTITGRQCESFASSWKPTRQMQGCIVYEKKQIDELNSRLQSEKRNGKTQAPSSKLKEQLKIHPLIMFSLKNMWESKFFSDYYIADLFKGESLLSANKYWGLTPNKNIIAAFIGAQFVSLGLKTLIFVDNPKNAESTARQISTFIDNENNQNLLEEYSGLINKIETELGDRKYSFITNDGIIGIHHGSMLPAERTLVERLFKQKKGLSAIVATPTLAQGVNLPAEVVIIAGDERYNEDEKKVERKEPYEILNAAGRAGRAGMSAQGIVIVIPGKMATIDNLVLSSEWWNLKNEVFSKSDQCLVLYDPLEFILDSIQDLTSELTEEQRSIAHRLSFDVASSTNVEEIYKRSLSFFRAKTENRVAEFEKKIEIFSRRKKELESDDSYPLWNRKISSYTGLDSTLIANLSNQMQSYGLEKIFLLTVEEQINLFANWVVESGDEMNQLLYRADSTDFIYKLVDVKRENRNIENFKKGFYKSIQLTLMWINGDSLAKIEEAIHSKPDTHCTRARRFALKIIPDLSFILGIFSMIIKEIHLELDKDLLDIPLSIRTLASCVREGVDSVAKLAFKYLNKNLSRVSCHIEFSESNLELVDFSMISTFDGLLKAIENTSDI